MIIYRGLLLSHPLTDLCEKLLLTFEGGYFFVLSINKLLYYYLKVKNLRLKEVIAISINEINWIGDILIILVCCTEKTGCIKVDIKKKI